MLRNALIIMKPMVTTAIILASSWFLPGTMADEASVFLRSAFESHCVACHGADETAEGDVDLVALRSTDDLMSHPELLERLIRVLADRQMPPEDEPPLPEDKRNRMGTVLRTQFEESLKTQTFGATPIHRMNRFQYNNAVVDLLELDRDIFLLNERLLRRRDNYFNPATGKMPSTVRVSSRPLSKDIDNQRPEGFRGVAAFPQDKRAEHGFDNRADHLSLSPLLMESFLQLSQTIVESPDLNPRECRSWDRLFATPGEPVRGPFDGRHEVEDGSSVKVIGRPEGQAATQNMQSFGTGWSNDAQLFWRCPKEGPALTLSFEVTEAGKGLRFGFTKAPDYGRFQIFLDDVMIGEDADLYDATVVPAVHDVSDLDLATGFHTLRFKCVGRNTKSTEYFFGLDFIDLTGREPRSESTHDTMSDADAIHLRIQYLLRRAFRRPVDPSTLERFTLFAHQQLDAGASFESTMRTVVGAILGMPDFLYFYEVPNETGLEDAAPVDQRVDDYELASRLGRFFWSSIPDVELLDLADAGRLSERDTLSKQIDRMLNDRRSSRFCENFPVQWLQLDRLVTSIPDPKKFAYFYYNGYRSSMHMMSEPLLLFETIYVEDRSVMDLLDPDFAWQSKMLQANYEGHANARKEVNVQVFERIPMTDLRRSGVMTCAAVMTMTSTPTRTQPITRGAWINSVIFNDPPDPPPADAPPLPEGNHEELAKLTIRERLAAHRQRADCASCHNKLDPLGFALENFGPTGVWRDTYENGRKVDAEGVLFNQYKFKTPVDFKRLILQEKHRFIRGFASHVLSYALGRELVPADSLALDDFTARALNGEDQMRTFLKNIAMSAPFLHKTIPPSAGQKTSSNPTHAK
jgi:hypothetical protein